LPLCRSSESFRAGAKDFFTDGLATTLSEIFRHTKNFLFANVPQANRFWKPAAIRARLAGTSLALNPFSRRMQWREPFGQLRTENREGRHTAERGGVCIRVYPKNRS